MNPLDSPPQWIIRLLRVAGALLIGAALVVWITSVNALGRNLVPVGCGSPATPDVEPLADFVCRDHIAGAKATAVALAVAAAVLLLLSEVALPRMGRLPWAKGVALAAIVALPVLALSASPLFTKVAASGADGTLIRCGTPLSPSTDQISKSLCGELASRQKSISLAGVGLSLLALAGGGYVAMATRPEDVFGDDTTEDEADPTPDPLTDPAPGSQSDSTSESPSDSTPEPQPDTVTSEEARS